MSFWGTFIAKQNGNEDDLLESIRYQLTVLLNSEAPMRVLPKQYKEVQLSNFSFGLDAAYSVSSQVNKEQFSRSLEKWVRAFEPRLSEVSVFVKESDPSKNIMKFSLMAKVDVQNGEHVFLFDSSISLSSQSAKMEGQEVV
ncbi:type VI secretion system baseplate subunit TssE [Photobacterium rosenbergii]|uniref:Type VI secretion system baseplate subunit TssE n=1 Tax=Photobacterium rosenbergii TaxID=294936 RepID=A0A2T3NKU5_9GAMM|nr:type VI secretion system baseplate subunit TssE [Photobacterium rosenbergii]MBY5947679.1 type VI secretion system baseplate subunit TssE [Photobacterium rosenbergii]PSW16138.1 type VI secretion system baseplate subunit TssE [Photobacterium rosenbergii]